MPRYAARAFTDRFLASCKPPVSGVVELTDGGARGLTMRITPQDTRTWVVRYSVRGKGQRKATIGRYPGMKLADARKRAIDIAHDGRQGKDRPAEEREKQAKEKTQAGHPKTLAELVDRYVQDYAKGHLRQWKQVKQALENHVLPRLGQARLADLRRADIVDLLDHLHNDKRLKAQVNSVRAHLASVFSWAHEREYVTSNPVASVRKFKGVNTIRERVLTDEELRKIWLTCDRLGSPGGGIVQALILTGQRRNEIRGLPVAELRNDGTWLLPGTRNKSRRNHLVPLPEAARDIFKRAHQAIGGPFVFSLDGKNPYGSLAAFKARLDEASGVGNWRYHDLRRTVRTRLAEMGVPADVARAVLNHSKPGLDRVYDQANMHEPMRKALDGWARRVLRIVAGGSNVVELARPA